MPPAPPRLLLIMGVAGSGKTTIGRGVADAAGWEYHEADDYHSPAAREKMGRGIPLTDEDRVPWLAAIRRAMEACLAQGRAAVFTCSALKAQYRRVLLDGLDGVALVHLTGEPALLLARLQGRTGHFMKPAMLESQLATLEPPADALTLDVAHPPEALIATIRHHCQIQQVERIAPNALARKSPLPPEPA